MWCCFLVLSHCQVALHNPFGNVEVAVAVSVAGRRAAGSAGVGLHVAMGVTVAHAEERKVLTLIYKYGPCYKQLWKPLFQNQTQIYSVLCSKQS